jgi:hypothetical protein
MDAPPKTLESNDVQPARSHAAHGSAWDRERVALANADYEERRSKDSSHMWNIRTVERDWRLKIGQLTNYRANRRRRKDTGVTVLYDRKNWPSSQNEKAET